MRLKIYRAGTVAEAMAQVRTELGADALILSTRRIANGVEMTAALEPQEDAPPPLPHIQAPQATQALTWHGIPESFARRLAAGPLAQSLHELLRFGDLPHGAGTAPLLLTGPPGAGKTLTAARLATRGRRAGAAEELAAYTRLLGISLVVASHPATLARALQHRAPGCPVLIDTTGASPFDRASIDPIAALAATAGATPVLVLPAGQDPHEAADQAAAFAETGVRHLLPTRLDLARRLGGIVTAAASGAMQLSEAGTGPGASDGLTQLTPEFLAARLSAIATTPASR